MKKIIIIISLFLCSQTIFAQLEKGMFAIGLSSGFTVGNSKNETDPANSNYSSNSRSKGTSYNIAPTVSYFLSNRFAVGISLGYSGYKSTNEYTNNDLANNSTDFNYSKTTSSGILISPYVKYYVPLGEKVYFLLGANASNRISTGETSGHTETTLYDAGGNTISTNRSNEFGPNKTNTVELNYGIGSGLLFMPSPKIGLEFSLGNLVGYNSRVAKTKNGIGGGTSKATNSGFQALSFNTMNVGTSLYYFF